MVLREHKERRTKREGGITGGASPEEALLRRGRSGADVPGS